MLLDVAQPLHVCKIKNRLTDLKPHRRVHLVDVQEIRPGPDKRDQRHHNRLPNRINRRIGHLRKELFEIVVQRLVFIGQDSQRRVVAHRSHRLFAIGRHGGHQKLEVLLAVAKGLLPIQQTDPALPSLRGTIGLAQGIEPNAKILDPLLIWLGFAQRGLELLVIDHSALLKINQKHFPRLQSPLADDLGLGHRQDARLRSHDHQIVICNAVARGPQAIAIQGRTNLPSIGKHDGGGAIPGLQHRGVVLIKRPTRFVHSGVLLPGLGNHHHGRLGHRISGGHQQLKTVIEGRRIRLTCKTDRIKLLQIRAQHGRAHHTLAGPHPVVIALDGVDFTVVGHHSIRMGQ